LPVSGIHTAGVHETFHEGKGKSESESYSDAEMDSKSEALDSRESSPATVGDHFADASDIFERISDGEFNPQHVGVKTYKRWDELENACQRAVRAWQRVPMRGRKTLAQLMGKVCDIMQEDNPSYKHNAYAPSKHLIPAGWYRAKAILQHGGDLVASALSEGARWAKFCAEESGKYKSAEERMAAYDDYNP
jgi:hypothetical protein